VAVFEDRHISYIKSTDGVLLREDILSWFSWQKEAPAFRHCQVPELPGCADEIVVAANKLFLLFPEFRSLYDYRTRGDGSLQGLKKELRRASEFYINCDSIGPRFRIQHGQNTYVNAREIGSDFWVNHNVTIGATRGGVPTIGSRVAVRTGAVVVGPIFIGNGCIINANAVVSSDMPDSYAAYAPRTVFRPRK